MDNRADQCFKHGQYDDALRNYSSLDRFPLAGLEMARIFLLTDQLDKAAESEQLAEEWLKTDANNDPWLIEGVSIPGRGQKLCYAQLSLAARGKWLTVSAGITTGDDHRPIQHPDSGLRHGRQKSFFLHREALRRILTSDRHALSFVDDDARDRSP